MKCSECGNDNPAESKTCIVCGHPLDGAAEHVASYSLGAEPASSGIVPVFPTALPQKVGPVGVGGWLMFFGISITFLAPLLILGADYWGWKQVGAAIAMYPAFAYPTYVLLAYDILIATYGIVVGFIILKGYPQGAKRAREYLWVRLILGVLSLGIAAALFASINSRVAQATSPALIRAGVQLLLWSTIWIGYFAVSKRVKNTYG